MSNAIYSHSLPIGTFTVYDDKPELKKLIHVHQIHSAEIQIFTGSDISDIKADGIIVLNKNIQDYNFAIKTADCIPAIFIGHKGISIIHAGWMGVRDKILVQDILEDIDPYYCFLGPSIHQDNFQVQEDFYQHFADGPYYKSQNGNLYFDLHSEAINQIKNKFPEIEIIDSLECTFEKAKYNSYRRDKTTQRNWNIFSI